MAIVPSSRIAMPQGMAYGWWHFPEALVQDLTFDIEIVAGDERSPGRYYQLYQGQIGGHGMYLGFQTHLMRPGIGWGGKGLLFSRWDTQNSEDAAPSPGGWMENSAHEGGFVGVRSVFEWGIGRYFCRLFPRDPDNVGVWYEYRVRRLSDDVEASPGALRFPFVKAQRPLIHSGGGSWTEVYRGAVAVEDVPFTQFDVRSLRANNNSLAPIRCDTGYNERFPLADSECTPQGVLSLRSGHGVVRNHAAGQYLISPCGT
jgi:hypothetical protein